MAGRRPEDNQDEAWMSGETDVARGLRTPSRWVERFLPGVRSGGRILDVACGGGCHLRLALRRGYRVIGVDRDLEGVEELRAWSRVELVRADLEARQRFPFAGELFDGVIVTNYLWRPILRDIVTAVAPDGLLIYETFAAGNERFGRPSNPDYLLRPGELVEAVRPRLVPVAYEHVTLSGPPRKVQRIAAVGPDHEWLIDPPCA
jgi:SAM-dependent methyltransferase